MRFVVAVEVRQDDGGSQWYRKVLNIPVGISASVLLDWPGVRLQWETRFPDPEGGVRYVCTPLDGSHWGWRLRESIFEPCGPQGPQPKAPSP